MSHRERPGRCFEFIREVCILKFFIADAFTDSLFGGNPAGVVIIPDEQDYPDDETMRKTAAELRYSETAFLRRLGDQSWQARYFTPAAEVELCGHATIGSAYCLRESGLIGEGVCRYKTLAGDLDILVQGHSVLMDMGFPRIVQDITDPGLIGEIYSTMGLNPAGRESEAAASALRFTRRAPYSKARLKDSSSLIPPVSSTLIGSCAVIDSSSAAFEPRPKAASRSTKCSHCAPASTNERAASSGVPYTVVPAIPRGDSPPECPAPALPAPGECPH